AGGLVEPAPGRPGALPAAGAHRLVLPHLRRSAHSARPGHRRPGRRLVDEPGTHRRPPAARAALGTLAVAVLAGRAAPGSATVAVPADRRGAGGLRGGT